MTGFEYSWVRDEQEFEALQDEWEVLLQRCSTRNMCMTWEWMWNWWRVYGERHRLSLLAIHRHGDLVGLVPLYQAAERQFSVEPARALRFLGNGETGGDFLDVICEAAHQREVLATMAQALIQASDTWDVLELAPLPADSLTRRFLGELFRKRRYAVGRAINTLSPYLDLPSSWDVFLHRIDKSLRSVLRYRTNQLMHKHRVRFERCRRPEEFEPFFAKLVQLHQRLWQGRGISGAFESEQYHRFHRNFAEVALHKDWLRLFLLKIDDETVGAVCGYHFEDIGYFFQMGHSSGWMNHHLDIILIGRAIRDAIDSGLTQFRFMRSDSEYTLRWTKHSQMNVHWVVRPEPRPQPADVAASGSRRPSYHRAV